MRTVAVIPARLGSVRLPGKVMSVILGKPLLGYLLDRLNRCLLVDECVVAAPIRADNDLIEEYCDSRGVLCFRGSEDDVLERLLCALRWRDASAGVVVFGDCPLIEPTIVDHCIEIYKHNQIFDFVGNDLKTTYPPGMEVEVFSVDALSESNDRCVDPVVREHGTLFLRSHPNLFNLHNIEAPKAHRRPEISLEVDTAEDLIVIEEIIRKFKGRKDFNLDEIINYIDSRPELGMVNRNIPRRWRKYRRE